jgi:hypothetical protein
MLDHPADPNFDADSEEVQRLRMDIYRRMTPARKYQQFLDLCAMAREMKGAALRQQHPDWTDRQVQHAVAEVFLHATD